MIVLIIFDFLWKKYTARSEVTLFLLCKQFALRIIYYIKIACTAFVFYSLFIFTLVYNENAQP